MAQYYVIVSGGGASRFDPSSIPDFDSPQEALHWISSYFRDDGGAGTAPMSASFYTIFSVSCYNSRGTRQWHLELDVPHTTSQRDPQP